MFAQNRKAYFLYDIIETFEAGVVLTGNEVKAIRNGQIVLTGAYALVQDNQLVLLNCVITPYTFAPSDTRVKEERTRVLLVHRREIRKIAGKIATKGMMLLPLKVYETKKKIIKIMIGLGKHKKLYERKQELKERDIAREVRREGKGNY